MPTIAGLLSIIAGTVGMLGGLIVIILLNTLLASSYLPEREYHLFSRPAAWVLFIPYFLFNIIAIAGGIIAMRRRLWGMALAGAVCSILGIWGWILGIASIVLLTLSKNEFGKEANFIQAREIGEENK
jgi:cellulose synthase/poly-beta-1,6-N-acetylglucosamine synthase-like glycosyltransferase